MNLQQMAALLLIFGFVAILVASSVGPPRIYQEPSARKQIELVGRNCCCGNVTHWWNGLVFPTRFFKSFPPQAFYLFTFMAGIVMLFNQ